MSTYYVDVTADDFAQPVPPEGTGTTDSPFNFAQFVTQMLTNAENIWKLKGDMGSAVRHVELIISSSEKTALITIDAWESTPPICNFAMTINNPNIIINRIINRLIFLNNCFIFNPFLYLILLKIVS